jgi:hypothetical protein
MGDTKVLDIVLMMLVRMVVLQIIGAVGDCVSLVLKELQEKIDQLLLLLQPGMLIVTQLTDLFYLFHSPVYLLF